MAAAGTDDAGLGACEQLEGSPLELFCVSEAADLSTQLATLQTSLQSALSSNNHNHGNTMMTVAAMAIAMRRPW